MASKVEVLCPNGHRVTVKTTPNTTVLQILEDACTKKGFEAAQYDLKHGRRTLDVTQTVRYAGLPNLAKLEMIKAAKPRKEADVILAFQLPNGERLQHQFSPSTTLWDILIHFEKERNEGDQFTRCKEENHYPVCNYMRDEVIGKEALNATTLRKLGLTGGKAIIRYQQREVSSQILDDIHSRLEKERAQGAKAGSQKVTPQLQANVPSPNPAISTTASSSTKVDQHHPQPEATSSDSDATSGAIPKTLLTQPLQQHLIAAVHENASNENAENQHMEVSSNAPTTQASTSNNRDTSISKSDSSTLPMDVSESETKHSKSDPCESMDVSNTESTSSSDRGRQPDWVDELNQVPGVQVFRPGDFDALQLPPEQAQMARHMAQAMLQQMMGGGPSHGQNSRQPAVQPAQEFKFPEATKGKNVYKNELSEFKKEEFKPCDREVVVYSLDETTSHTEKMDEDLPDDFFDVTESDVKKMYADMQRRMKEEVDQPLMTEAMRQARQEAKYSKYERVAIRVYFPDRMVLQGLFRPRESVHALHKFVKDNMENASLPYYLYTTPPKCILKEKTQTLIEAKLVPMSVVYFGCEEKDKQDHYIKSSLMSEAARQETADVTMYRYLRKSVSTEDTTTPTPGTSASTSSGATSSSQTKRAATNTTSSSSSNDPKKVPKWFKMGPK